MSVRSKKGVEFGGFTEGLVFLLDVLLRMDTVFSTEGQPPILVITSGSDGKHSKNSRHYTFEAIDVRSKDFPTLESKKRFRAAFEESLGPQFRVLLENLGGENEHFHCQVKRGEHFP